MVIRFGKGRRERELRQSELGRQQLLSAMKMLGLEPSSPTAREMLGWTESDDVDAVEQKIVRAEERLEEARRRGVSARDELELMVDLNSWRKQLGAATELPKSSRPSRPTPPIRSQTTQESPADDEIAVGVADDSGDHDYVDAQRFAFAYERISAGWSKETARVVSWAILPFPSSPVPSRELEKLIRTRCSQLAKELRRSQSSELESLGFAQSAAEDYVKIAKRLGDRHFAGEWNELLIEAIECGKRFP